MAVLDNTIKAEDLVKAQDIEFIANFQHDVDDLQRVLGITTPEVIAAGTTIITSNDFSMVRHH